MRVKIIKYVVMALAVIAGIVWYAVVSMSGKKDGLSITMESTSYEAAVVSTGDSGGDRTVSNSVMEEANDETTSVGSIFVYVCGAVTNPGVYELHGNVRVVAAIEAAGGFCEGAARDYLNLARVLTDGEMIDVPTMEEAEAGLVNDGAEESKASLVSGKEDVLSVNINTATKEELMELPGIGESRALSIIAYREENGTFGSIEEIMLVSGIKEGAFAKIKAYIRVTP